LPEAKSVDFLLSMKNIVTSYDYNGAKQPEKKYRRRQRRQFIAAQFNFYR
jgi:hypothetical protein